MAVSLEHEIAIGDVVIGVDEAGRGPLAGGVFAAAVHVPLARAAELLDGEWAGVNDSKKLTAKRRDSLAAAIRSADGCVWAVASASPAEIDSLNILNATHLAMRRAVEQVLSKIHGDTPPKTGDTPPRICGDTPPKTGDTPPKTGDTPPKIHGDTPSKTGDTPHAITALVDGLPVRGLPVNSKNIIKGDAKSLLIAAASILAKTARDADCLRLEKSYPGYGFAKHKGYPTPEHLAALDKLGPCPEHRRSFGPVAQTTFAFNLDCAKSAPQV